MALNHHFLFVSSDISNQMIQFRQEYISDGIIKRYANFEAVPKPINSFADDTAGDILMDYYKKNKVRAVCVHDKYILKNLLKFESIETYFIGFIPCMGLNYYGFTLVPWESIPEFISVLKKYSARNCFTALIFLCTEAYSMKHDILHCGI